MKRRRLNYEEHTVDVHDKHFEITTLMQKLKFSFSSIVAHRENNSNQIGDFIETSRTGATSSKRFGSFFKFQSQA